MPSASDGRERIGSVIVRVPGTVAIDVVSAPTIDALLQALDQAGLPRNWVASDLSLGGWRSHQVAQELFAQIGIPMPADPLPAMRSFAPADRLGGYADQLGSLVDAEAFGDRRTLRALQLAESLVLASSETPRTFVVVAPRYGLPWETEDLLFLRFLVQGLRGSRSRLVLAVDGPDRPMPRGFTPNWLGSPGASVGGHAHSGWAALVPGILEPALATAFTSGGSATPLFALPNQHWLVPPECREDPAGIGADEFDALAAAARPFPWLRAFALCFGSRDRVDTEFLCSEAWRRFAEGSEGVPLRLIDRAIACAPDPVAQAAYLAQAQGMRISTQRFDEVASVADAPPFLPGMLRGFLAQAKGWGLVMSSEPARAEPYLRTARVLLQSLKPARPYWWLLNISALSRLKQNDVAGALAMETEIETGIAAGVRDSRLEYVNSINIARLHRRTRNSDLAAAYYGRAFGTTLGARSENDTLYTNVCWAKLETERGRPAEAFLAWLRASLHWTASRVPEALGKRVAFGVLGRDPSPDDDLSETISAALSSYLVKSAETSGMVPANVLPDQPELDTSDGPAFLRTDILPGMGRRLLESAWGKPGVSVLGGRLAASVPLAGPANRHLRILLRRMLAAVLGAEELLSLTTLVIDDRFGREIPVTAAELVEACVRLHVPRVVFDGAERTLVPEDWARLERQSRVRPGTAIANIDWAGPLATVSFKRYLATQRLTEDESRILALAADGPSLEELGIELADRYRFEDLVTRVRALEAGRILHLDLLDDVIPDAAPSRTMAYGGYRRVARA